MDQVPDEIDLAAAKPVLRRSPVRQARLTQLLSRVGLSAGYGGQHGRVLSFVEALREAGYVVVEEPHVSRGGRRYVLLSFGGEREAWIHRLRRHCVWHPHAIETRCHCFDDLSTGQLALAEGLRRRMERSGRVGVDASVLLEAVRRFDEATLYAAADVFTSGPRGRGHVRFLELAEAVAAALS